MSYRLDDELPLEWIGNGLREVGIEPGAAMTESQKQWARALMSGTHPQTGEVLVTPKLAVDPRAKLPAAPLVGAVGAAAAERGLTVEQQFAHDARAKSRYERAVRGVFREGGHHAISVQDLSRIATAARLHLDEIYSAADLEMARMHRNDKVVVGNRGYDLTLDLSKSVSVLYAMADTVTAAEIENTYLAVVRETVAALEGWAAYGLRGHHGDGQRAARMPSSGLLGWMMLHRTARPVDANAPDPHLHAHLALANMVKGMDGNWSTVAAGGRDFHRHAHAADAFLKARMRQITGHRWGVEWARDEHTGAWEIAYIPPAARDLFSKRSGQVRDTLERLGLDPDAATIAQSKDAAARSREDKHPPGPGGDLRGDWQRQAIEANLQPAQLVAQSMPGREADEASAVPPTPEEIATWVFRDGQSLNGDRRPWTYRDEHGLTTHSKVTTRADVLAAVMDAMPGGISSLAEAEALTDAVLGVPGYAVRLPDRGARHLSNHERYTTADILAAERAILAQARVRFGEGAAVAATEIAAAAKAAFEAVQGFTLSEEQHLVLDRLLHSGHGVDAVIGVAGAGKTTIMSAARAAYQAEGRTIAGATTAAVAAANLRAEAGIPSLTVAGWMARIEAGRGLSDVDVLVIDEAATVDDRQMARLLAHAGQTGTKVIGIGDPLQLRAPGVGGAFAAVHQLVGGTTLFDNRRQTDDAERHALALWRDGERMQALAIWASTGRVHAVTDANQAHAALLASWEQVRHDWPNPHDRIEQLLILAGTNADVDKLNVAAQAIRRELGELGTPNTYQLRGGGHLKVHIGDQVMFRVNERRPGDGVDVLNGYRGIVTGFGQHGEVEVQWRQPPGSGEGLLAQSVSSKYVINGGLSLGYALTVAKAQGLTAQKTLVYGNGMDTHTLYPALSRARGETHLWLARELLEDDADRARLGLPRNPQEEISRALAGFHAALQRSAQERLVLAELQDVDLSTPTRRPQPVPLQLGSPASTSARNGIPRRVRGTKEAANDMADLEHAALAMAWRATPAGRLTDAELSAAIVRAEKAVAQNDVRQVIRQSRVETALSQAQAGQGRVAQALSEERAHLYAAKAAEARAVEQERRANDLRQEISALQLLYAQNPFVLSLRGTSRARIDGQIEQRRAAALLAELTGGRARAEAEHHRRLANVALETPATVALAGFEQTWDQRQASAVAADIASATLNAASAQRLAAVASARDRALTKQLTAERRRREGLSNAQAAAERTDRARWMQADANRQAKTGEAQRKRTELAREQDQRRLRGAHLDR